MVKTRVRDIDRFLLLFHVDNWQGAGHGPLVQRLRRFAECTTNKLTHLWMLILGFWSLLLELIPGILSALEELAEFTSTGLTT